MTSKSRFLGAAALGIAFAMAGTASLAADKVLDVGKGEYDAACAVCHGVNGKGGGPLADQLKGKVPDLTVLARNNKGVFPFDRVHQVVDGREEVKSHGTREMPVWGQAFRRQSSVFFQNHPAHDPESGARSRMLALVEYVYRLQDRK